MALLEFNDERFTQMRAVQGEVVKALLPFRERTEAAIVVFALIRAARVMLRLYPKKTQVELLEAIVPYLEGKAEMPDTSTSPFLIH
jgi:hypothetical protein